MANIIHPSSHLAVAATLMIAGIIAMSGESAVAAPRPRPSPPPRASPPVSGPGPVPSPGGVQQQFSNMYDFIRNCAFYMHIATPRFFKPNEKCCTSIKKVNVPLFCKIFFIPNTEKVFSPRKVARVAKYCKVPLPVKSRCGTYKVKENPLSIEEQLSQ